MTVAYSQGVGMVLRAYMYGDPAEWLDRKRAEDKAEAKRKEQRRKHKARRIACLARLAIKGKLK